MNTKLIKNSVFIFVVGVYMYILALEHCSSGDMYISQIKLIWHIKSLYLNTTMLQRIEIM